MGHVVTPDGSSPTHHPRGEVERAAARVLAARRLAVVLALVWGAASVAVLVLSLTGHGPRGLVVAGVLMAASAVHVIYRLLPRTPGRTDRGMPLSAVDGDLVRAWIADQCEGWRPDVRLVPHPVVSSDRGTLVLGMPLVTCLHDSELAELVRDCVQHAASDDRPVVRRALDVTDGWLGLRARPADGSTSRRWYLRPVATRLDALDLARATLSEQIRLQHDDRWTRTVSSLSLVDEGWRLVVETWLEPALRLGVWHDTPFTGLRHVIDGLTDDEDRLEGPDLLTLFPTLAAYEQTLAERLVEGAPHDDLPTPWSAHPLAVSDRTRRASLATVVAAVTQATGAPESASVRALHRVFSEGWGPAVAAALGRPDDEPGVEQLAQQTVTDAVTTLLVDTGVAVLGWEWPVGTVLRDTDGARLFVADVVASGTPLHCYLSVLGVDAERALQLAGGVAPSREQSLLAVTASQGLSSRRLVLSDRALWVFRLGEVRGVAQRVRFAATGEVGATDPCMSAVDGGETSGALGRVGYHEVVRATFSPLVGGHWWRLRLRLADGGAVTLRGESGGRELERFLDGVLGERLRTRWSHERPVRRRARNVFGYCCLGLGGLGLVVALVSAARPSPDLALDDSLVLAALSLGTVLLGLLPDLAALALDRRRGVAPHDARGAYDLA